MPKAQQANDAWQAPVMLAQRSLAALVLLIALAIGYATLAEAGAVPVPGSLASLSHRHAIGHDRVILSGYYIAQPFVSLGGVSLPPYVFAADTQTGAPGVHVSPNLPDLRAGRVAAIVDTATGDGSRWSPYVIRTLARWDSFVTALIVGGLIVLAFAFWLAGPAVALVRRWG